MLKKDFKKAISTTLAAAMIMSCSAVSFAENTGTPTQNPADTTVTEPSDTQTDTLDIQARAVYIPGSEANTYEVTITSTTELVNLKNFEFSVNTLTENSAITEFELGTELQCQTAERTLKNGDKTVKFSKGAETTLISGTPVLCTLTVSSTAAPDASNLTLTDFTAYNSENTKVTITAALTIIEQPVMTDNAKAVYDALLELPDADTLSFYTDNEGKVLADIEKISKEINDTADAYNALSDNDKESIRKTSEFNQETLPNLDTLKALTADMLKVSDIIALSMTLSSINEKDLVNYRFLTDVYTSDVALSQDDEAKLTFGDGSALKTQYSDAKTSIETNKGKIDTPYIKQDKSFDDFSDNIVALNAQLTNVQKLSGDANYEKYLENLNTQAKSISNELKNFEHQYQSQLVNDINSYIASVVNIQKGLGDTPTVTYPTIINYRYSYTVNLTRKLANAVEADVKIVVYKEGETTNPVDTMKFDYAASAADLECEMVANTNYPGTENVDIYVYYIISGAEFLIGTETIYCNVPPQPTAPGIPNGNKNNSSSGGSSSGGTKFPTANNDAEDDNEDNEDTKDDVLFEDIKNYGWAQEAIEGLYYVGIVNGMEEGIFNPAGNVTREQFCKMVVQLFEVTDDSTETDFADVDENAWYAPYISSAIRAGYVQGQSDDYFGIGESIMRQDMATILYRALNYHDNKAELNFTDIDDIAPYAEDAIAVLVGLEVLNGYEDGSFKPRGTATRAEAAKVIWAIYNIINDK